MTSFAVQRIGTILAVADVARSVAYYSEHLGFAVEVAECRRQTVTPMIKRRAAHGPQGILKPFGQRDKALAAENDVGMFEAGPDKPEVIK